MSVRTYNPSVRVGNWNEDLCLEEVLRRMTSAWAGNELKVVSSQDFTGPVG